MRHFYNDRQKNTSKAWRHSEWRLIKFISTSYLAIIFLFDLTEVPASRNNADVQNPYDSEMDDSQSDNVLLKSRGMYKLKRLFKFSLVKT